VNESSFASNSQNGSRWRFPLRMTNNPYDTLPVQGSNIIVGCALKAGPDVEKKRWGRSVLPYQEPEEST
jgi:hypothetical protein